MKFDLSRFLDGDEAVYPLEGKIESESLNYENIDLEVTGHIEFKGEIFKVDGEYLVNDSLWYEYTSHCDRCLKPTTGKIKSNLSGKLAIKTGELNDEDGFDEFIYLENDVLDIDEYIINEAVAAEPMKSLCKSNCKGLCSQCGIDFNTHSCNCLDNLIDPRLEKLKDLFPEK